MRLHVGPLPSHSARAWITYARDIVDGMTSGGAEAPVASDLLEAFERYLDEWSAAADRSERFDWETEIPSELAEYQAHAFHQIANRLAEAAEARGQPMQPPEGETFYRALVNAIIDALLMEGDATAEYALHLRSFWPGFGEAAGPSIGGVGSDRRDR